jgi:hypothetical protein
MIFYIICITVFLCTFGGIILATYKFIQRIFVHKEQKKEVFPSHNTDVFVPYRLDEKGFHEAFKKSVTPTLKRRGL